MRKTIFSILAFIAKNCPSDDIRFILLTKTAAALSYHKVRVLYFLVVIFAATIEFIASLDDDMLQP